MNPFAKVGLFIVVAVIVIGLAVAVGRYTAPERVVETVKLVETVKVVERVDEKKLEALTEQMKLALTRIEQLKKSIHKEKTKKTFPDGTIEEKEVVDINIDRTVQTTEVKEVEKQVVVIQEKVIDRIVETEVMVEKLKLVESPKAQWKVGALVGMNLKDLASGQSSPAFSFGGRVERRVIGPIWGGVGVLSDSTTIFSLSVEF